MSNSPITFSGRILTRSFLSAFFREDALTPSSTTATTGSSANSTCHTTALAQLLVSSNQFSGQCERQKNLSTPDDVWADLQNPGPSETLKESCQTQAGLLYRECRDFEDAKNYLDECISDIAVEHPNADEMEIRSLLIDSLQELFKS